MANKPKKTGSAGAYESGQASKYVTGKGTDSSGAEGYEKVAKSYSKSDKKFSAKLHKVASDKYKKASDLEKKASSKNKASGDRKGAIKSLERANKYMDSAITNAKARKGMREAKGRR